MRHPAMGPARYLKSTSDQAEMMKSSPVDMTFAPLAMFRKVSLPIIVLVAVASLPAQTFEIGGQQSQSAPQAAQKQKKTA